VDPSLKVVVEVISYVEVAPLKSFTVTEVADTVVTTPPAKFVAPAGDAEVAVGLSWALWWDVADAMPAPPATRPTPSSVVAATRFIAIFWFSFMMYLSLRSFETISN
jgi:hypothetical protein